MANHTLINSSAQSKRIAPFLYTIECWALKDAHELYLLEKSCWAPWLQKSETDFLTIASKYAKLQRLIRNKYGIIVASMSVNRINWDGNAETLPSWNEIAGGAIQTSNFTPTYTPDGNTLCLMSMNVSHDLQGIGLAQKLIEELKNIARELKIKHIISSLRPVDYGDYKLNQIRSKESIISFTDYCKLENKKGKPYDRWLRSAFHQGIRHLFVSKDAIVVKVTKDQFKKLIKTYHPNRWKQIAENKWECGETGSWSTNKNFATYKEDNLAVEIPIGK